MKLTFIGAAHEVTGSCTLLETNGKNILIDCGMEQGINIYENCELPVAPSLIDCVLLTHAHIDHSGLLPKLCADGFTGEIICTKATQKLCNIMLLDSAHIQEFEATWRNRKGKRAGRELWEPLYTINDAQASLKQFCGYDYGEEIDLYSGIKIKFIDAGHLLGSSSIEVRVNENGTEKTLLFSGDIGNIDRPLIRNPQKPEYADIVVCESTYGNRLHGEREDYCKQLAQVIQMTLDRGGNVVIPSFAVGRTQEMLYLLHQIKEKNMVVEHGNFPIFIDSPLAVEATKIYDGGEEMMPYYDEEMLEFLKNGIDVLKVPGLEFAITSQDSMNINTDMRPKVIISASGMCDAGRIRHHLKHNLWLEDSTILFVGYQAEGTIGRQLLDGANEVKMFGEIIKVNAEIVQMSGISGHADHDMLIDWLGNLKQPPERVFVNHGGDTVCDEFADSIKEELGYDAVAPYSGGSYDLITGECLNKGNTVKVERKSRPIKESSAMLRLISAGQRLQAVIEKNRGGANKDLGKFADQINELCRKWDR